MADAAEQALQANLARKEAEVAGGGEGLLASPRAEEPQAAAPAGDDANLPVPVDRGIVPNTGHVTRDTKWTYKDDAGVVQGP